jgi:hypothetical protein
MVSPARPSASPLRKRLEIELGNLEERQWRHLLQRGLVVRWDNAPSDHERERRLEECRTVLEDYKAGFRDAHQSLSEKREVTVSGGNKAERWYADLLSRDMARRAAADPLVPRLRAWLGEPPLLIPARARAVLASPILPFMTMDELVTRGIQPKGHIAKVTVIEEGSDDQAGPWEDVRIRVKPWPGGQPKTEHRRLFLRDSRFVLLPLVAHRAVDPDTARVHPGSVFDVLWQHAQRIANRYHWTQSEAIAFLLAGEQPEFRAITGTGTSMSIDGGPEIPAAKIVALVQVSPDSVKATFKRIQRMGLSRKGPAPPLRRCALALFAGPLRADGVTWKEVLDLWNLEVRMIAPAWGYSDYRQLARDCNLESQRSQRRKGRNP